MSEVPLYEHGCAWGSPEEGVKRFRGGLVFKAHRHLYHSTLGFRVIKKKKKAREVRERPVSVCSRSPMCRTHIGKDIERPPPPLADCTPPPLPQQLSRSVLPHKCGEPGRLKITIQFGLATQFSFASNIKAFV